ncbi:MAG TPA: metal-sensing transcriptional repressor [Patescibacteria group bacterium]|nr:metal-sensing transcriptional repressor [Patescibacteria group bacterium]
MNNWSVRLNRLIGQIEGIRKMIEKRRNTAEIVQQILAAREALAKIGLILIKETASKKGGEEKKLEKLLEAAFRLK